MMNYIQAKGWRRIYIWLFLTTPFMLFIMEEGIQTLGFGRYTLVQGDLWEEALEAVKVDRKINKVCYTIAICSFPLNPLAGTVFTLYFWADAQKMQREVIRIENELWGYTTHDISQKENAIVATITQFGSRKLALLVIAVTLVIFVYYRMNRHTMAKPTGGRRFAWTEADMREAVRKIEIDETQFIEFCNQNKIPLSGKEKR